MKHYSLDNRETPKFIRILQIIFGITCILIAAVWTAYMVMPESENAYWLPTVFILFFGCFQIYSGLGYAARYIGFEEDKILVRNNSLGRKKVYIRSEITSISILPLGVEIRLRNGSAEAISFGLSIAGSIDAIKDAFGEFAAGANIELVEKSDIR